MNSSLKMQTTDDKLEELTKRFGRQIFRTMRAHAPSRFSPSRLDDAVMQMLMKDEELRYRMLRFVDVYPALKSSEALAKHLEEYLTAPELATVGPGPLTALARRVGKARPATRELIRLASKFGILRMARQFIAGHTPEDVAEKIRGMESEGFLFSLDLLGEFVVSESQAEEFSRRYLEMAERFESLLSTDADAGSEAGARVNISIKLSSLTSKFDPMDQEGTSDAVRRRLRPLLRVAKQRNIFINVDMEKYEYRDLTLAIVLDLLDEAEFAGFPHIGTVHQAYLKDALSTLEWFLGELRKRQQPMTIRLVKGAYWDSEQIWARTKGWPIPVITVKDETDANYERC
ncbi:MAG: proline dehydrogenase family protein, partial [Candidatus Sumerlaeota bacterium]